MPTPDALAAFSLASLLLILLPGPSVLFVIGRSLAHGHRGGLLSVLGNELGALPLIAAVAFGVGALVAESVVLFTIVKFLGAAYLVYWSVQTIRQRAVGISLVCDAIWAIAASAARNWFASSPKRLETIRASGGTMMVGLGGALAFTGSKA